MCKSSLRRRSPDLIVHQTLSKGWCRDGSGLLLGFIVRPRGRLVEAQSLLRATEARSACPAHRLGGHHPGHPRPVAPLQNREGLLEIRPGAPAPLYFPVLCSQSQLDRRIRALGPELRLLQRAFSEKRSEPSAVYRVMDTTLVPAIVRV